MVKYGSLLVRQRALIACRNPSRRASMRLEPHHKPGQHRAEENDHVDTQHGRERRDGSLDIPRHHPFHTRPPPAVRSKCRVSLSRGSVGLERGGPRTEESGRDLGCRRSRARRKPAGTDSHERSAPGAHLRNHLGGRQQERVSTTEPLPWPTFTIMPGSAPWAGPPVACPIPPPPPPPPPKCIWIRPKRTWIQ